MEPSKEQCQHNMGMGKLTAQGKIPYENITWNSTLFKAGGDNMCWTYNIRQMLGKISEFLQGYQ